MPESPIEIFERLRRLFLEEWHIGVHGLDETLREYERGAVSFAQIALRASFFLNGGALVVLPAYLSLLGVFDTSSPRLLGAGGSFVGGLILAWLGTFAAYFTMIYFGKAVHENREVVAMKLHNSYEESRGQPKTHNDSTIKEHERHSKDAAKVGQRWRIAGIVLAGLSFAAFVCGALLGASVLLGEG